VRQAPRQGALPQHHQLVPRPSCIQGGTGPTTLTSYRLHQLVSNFLICIRFRFDRHHYVLYGHRG
jgi:hypothetical protein